MNRFVSETDLSEIGPDLDLIRELALRYDNGDIGVKGCCCAYHESMLRQLTGAHAVTVRRDTLVLELVEEEVGLGMVSIEQSCERYHGLMISTMATELKDYETPLVTQSSVVLMMLLDRVAAGIITHHDCCVRYNELMSREYETRIAVLELNQRRYEKIRNMESGELVRVLNSHDGADIDEILDSMEC